MCVGLCPNMASQITAIKRSDLKHVKSLGEGGFSSVYQMKWTRLQGPIDVAAKKLMKRNLHEPNVMFGLNHPNIVKLYGVVDEDIDFLLILELCEKGSLRSYLDENSLSQEKCYDWIKQAALPLEYLKQNEIVHKDLKSPNYLITANGTLKLGDFGLAKNLGKTISNATGRGSYQWMAPELLRHQKLSPKYDIFSFGVVVWEMVSGKFPHVGLEYQQIVWKVCETHQDEPLSIPEDCPEAIRKLMMWCWKYDWKMRPDIEQVISLVRWHFYSRLG